MIQPNCACVITSHTALGHIRISEVNSDLGDSNKTCAISCVACTGTGFRLNQLNLLDLLQLRDECGKGPKWFLEDIERHIAKFLFTGEN